MPHADEAAQSGESRQHRTRAALTREAGHLELRLLDWEGGLPVDGPQPLQLLDLAVEMRFRPQRLREREGITEDLVLAWWGKARWQAAQHSAKRLLATSADLCDRAREHDVDLDVIARQLRDRHPGFPESAYDSAVEYGMFVSR